MFQKSFKNFIVLNMDYQNFIGWRSVLSQISFDPRFTKDGLFSTIHFGNKTLSSYSVRTWEVYERKSVDILLWNLTRIGFFWKLERSHSCDSRLIGTILCHSTTASFRYLDVRAAKSTGVSRANLRRWLWERRDNVHWNQALLSNDL